MFSLLCGFIAVINISIVGTLWQKRGQQFSLRSAKVDEVIKSRAIRLRIWPQYLFPITRTSRLVFACLAASVASVAQSNPSTDEGMKPYDSFHGGAIDSISMTSGNLFAHKQLYSSAQRGRATLTLSMQYNNKGYRLQTACTTTTTTVCDYTWHWQGSGMMLIPDQRLGISSQHVDSGFQTSTGQEIWVYVYTAQTSDGSMHPLADTGNGYRSIDASGILWNGSSFTTAQDRNGMYETFGGTTADTNGNFTSTDSSGNWTDTLGRVVPAIPGPTPLQPPLLPARLA